MLSHEGRVEETIRSLVDEPCCDLQMAEVDLPWKQEHACMQSALSYMLMENLPDFQLSRMSDSMLVMEKRGMRNEDGIEAWRRLDLRCSRASTRKILASNRFHPRKRISFTGSNGE